MKPEQKYTRIALILLTIFILLMLLFIWGNSVLPAGISSKISSFVARLLGKSEAEGTVRKAGHFTEFFVLGSFLGLYVTLRGTKGKDKAVFLVFPALFVPLMDETIQMFNDRGPQVRDIWIDIAGYTCGCLLAQLVFFLARLFLRSRKKRRDVSPGSGTIK